MLGLGTLRLLIYVFGALLILSFGAALVVVLRDRR
jgi:hypothetical protein